MTAKPLRIGGVPEHFNFPWHLAIEDASFEEKGVEVSWQNVPEGTGAMANGLKNHELDLAVMLTEGAVARIIMENHSSILQQYISSPLKWGVHVAADSGIQDMSDLEKGRFGISRYGSGSHMMAYVNALRQGWNPHKLQFVPIGKLGDLVQGICDGRAEAFLWDKFMTHPYVDSGQLRKLGECPTPWPCFVIAANNYILNERPQDIKKVLNVINSKSAAFMKRDDVAELLSERYNLTKENVEEWFNETSWETDIRMKKHDLEEVMDVLWDLELIPEKQAPETLCAPFTKVE